MEEIDYANEIGLRSAVKKLHVRERGHVLAKKWIDTLKSKLSKVNRLDSNDILLHKALTDAEFEFFDTIYVKIGCDKGYIHYWSKKGSTI